MPISTLRQPPLLRLKRIQVPDHHVAPFKKRTPAEHTAEKRRHHRHPAHHDTRVLDIVLHLLHSRLFRLVPQPELWRLNVRHRGLCNLRCLRRILDLNFVHNHHRSNINRRDCERHILQGGGGEVAVSLAAAYRAYRANTNFCRPLNGRSHAGGHPANRLPPATRSQRPSRAPARNQRVPHSISVDPRVVHPLVHPRMVASIAPVSQPWSPLFDAMPPKSETPAREAAPLV
mmetsp:Transcript_17825/g.46683  ORF Transcript_17825/g.46683 Transcript_17825/m.46683 type:complete len:231 (-) Transcript_17825:47-739(-)